MEDGRVAIVCAKCGNENRVRLSTKPFTSGAVVKHVQTAGAGVGGLKCLKCNEPLSMPR